MRLRPAVLFAWLLVPIAAEAAPGAAPRVTSSVDHVVVYSDQARVFRSASVSLEHGPLVVAVADLPAAVIVDSIRVECDSAEVQRVEVGRTRDGLPRQEEAKALLARIQQVADGLRALDDEQRVLRSELGLVEALQPAAQRPRPEKEPAMIFVETWRRVLAWGEGRAARLRARLAAVEQERWALEQKLGPLRVEAGALQLAAARSPSARVVVTLAGKPGRHRLVLSYLVGQVRWLPSYDLAYDDGRQSVEASYYAVLTQTTGEDWKDARLSFSTTMPAVLVAVPELPTWTLGRRTDFTPTPRARPEPPAVAWAPPQPVEPADPLALAFREVVGGEVVTETGTYATSRDEDKRRADGDGKKQREVYRRRTQYNFEDDTVQGDLVKPEAAAAAPRPRVTADSMSRVPGVTLSERAVMMPGVRGRRLSRSAGSSRGESAGPPREVLPWTDTGYVAPALDPDLPAASAKGYRYTLDAPGRHSVAASGIARRVPLLRQRFAVSPVYTIVPGRSQAAYLTAEVDNSSGRPILRGQANLFVGTTYSGQTRLETALPGAKLMLPLGVDDRVKVSRITTQRTVTQGVVFKDDATEYTVTVEVANHRRQAVRVEVEDQVPLGKRDAQIEAFGAEPAVGAPDEDGRVRFKTTVGGASVAKLVFRYRIVRPKDWQLRQ
ncbi:MAG TPA: mucoidy inhibitor MuiA family protein [Polyangia bacterium]|jgi:hypothetical protein